MRKILSILVLGILFASCYNTGEPRKNVLTVSYTHLTLPTT